MNREAMLARLARHKGAWDLVVIGGGATGAGVALDAASRGYSVALLEQSDFGKGTSSRSTKLVHGGVRYLQQGNVSLVREALRERAILRRNAPHLVGVLPLIVPAYTRWERVFYATGLTAYDLLAAGTSFGRSRILSRQSTVDRLATIAPDGLRGGILYHDGQFDDARLLINLLQSAAEQGAVVLNYVRVHGLTTSAGRVDGVVATDEESGDELRLPARVVINATGAFVDGVRRLAEPAAPSLIAASQGTHVVISRRFLPGNTAVMIPRLPEGRVMFAIPWQGHTLVGTTDTPIAEPALEPRPLEREVQSILEIAARYLRPAPGLHDVLSAFAGVRPLVRRGETRITAALSRDHVIDDRVNGLITTTGGKWTTYRRMAEQAVDRAALKANLPTRPCVTQALRIHGAATLARRHDDLAAYGSDAPVIAALADDHPELALRLDGDLPCTAGEVVWAARHEMARSVEDVLARRTRALFLNVEAALRMAPIVAVLLAEELGRSDEWRRAQCAAFAAVARGYSVTRREPVQEEAASAGEGKGTAA